MKKFLKLFLSFCLTAFIISGCGANNAPKPLCRVVTGVDIACRQEHMLIRRHYTDHKKMQSVLLYLRLLDTLGQAKVDPEAVRDDVYEITVHLSDGNRHIYRQAAHRYFRRNAQPWEMIDSAQAAQLYTLMRQLPSDPQL